MKRPIFVLLAVMSTICAQAQQYYQDSNNPDILRHTSRHPIVRTEFVLPQVNGYNVYKADLHVHSFYSDGNASPEYRVNEAWHDGLDVMAMTDHVEWRPHEDKMLTYLKGYFKGETPKKPANEEAILTDLNVSVALAQAAAESYGLTIIPGIEVTRDPLTVGHYNALFTTDNNKIFDPDPYQSVRNAKAQGAIVMSNHPGWRRKSLDMIDFEKKLFDAKLVDGIETMNGAEFYPKAITRAHALGLFVAGNTDIHGTTSEEYIAQGNRRNMTLILAKDKSLPSLKDALLKRRTLAYSFGTLAGEEQLLKDFFNACVSTEVVYENGKGTKRVNITNNSSVPYVLRFGNENPVYLDPFKTIIRSVSKGKSLIFTVESMWCDEDSHPVIERKLR